MIDMARMDPTIKLPPPKRARELKVDRELLAADDLLYRANHINTPRSGYIASLAPVGYRMHSRMFEQVIAQEQKRI